MSGYHEGEMKYSFKAAGKETLNLMKTVYTYILFGAAVGSVIYEAVPTEWISTYLGGDKWSRTYRCSYRSSVIYPY